MEIRSTGGQTIVPSSVHDTGEPYIWHEDGDPGIATIGELRQSVGRVAAAALLARHWPAKGCRHDLLLALAGGLLVGGIDDELAEDFIRAVCEATGSDHIDDQVKGVKDTRATIAAGDHVTGWPRVAELIGKDGDAVVSQMRAWLGVRRTEGGGTYFGRAEERKDDSGTATVRPTAWQIIRDYWQETLAPTFKRPGAIHSDRAGREFERRELTEGAPPDLIDLLKGADNAPLHKGTTTVNVELLPRLFATWAPTAWAALLKQLPDEVSTAEASESASEQFRTKLRAALLKLVAIGTVHDRGKDDEYTTVERRPLLHWAEIFARANLVKGIKGWSDVRGHFIWARSDGSVFRVAMHVDLFAQLHASGLPDTPRKFAEFARLYEVAAQGEGPKVRGGNLRLIELSSAFIQDLLPEPEDLATDRRTGDFSRACAREAQSFSPSEGVAR